MKPEPCVICGSAADLHVDDLRNHHIGCPKCGNYIATDGFSVPYQRLDEELRREFAAWMIRTSDKPDRFLYKTRPLKSNPYCAADGFDMISINRIQAGTFDAEKREKTEA